MEQRGGLGGDDDGSATPSASRSSGGVSTQQGDESLRGLADVLNETWDTAESPNFAAALQASGLELCWLVCDQGGTA